MKRRAPALSESDIAEEHTPLDVSRLPWSRHTPTPWRAVRQLRVAIACDAEDTPRLLTEGLARDGHKAFWTSRDRLIGRLRERPASADAVPAVDVVVVSARLIGGLEGVDLLSTLCSHCVGASLVLLGADTQQKASLARNLRKNPAIQQVLMLGSPADVDDLRMLVMHVSARRAESGFHFRAR
jgi:hypothetical protein